MAQIRGQGTEQSRRHAEDEENDDGWCAVLVVAAVVFVLACMVTVISPVKLAVTGGVSYWLSRKGLWSLGGHTTWLCYVQHFVTAITE